MDPQDKSVKSMKQVFEALDPIPLCSLYNISGVSKSTALGLHVLYGDGEQRLDLERAVNIARVDEHF
jgi:chaperone required for assembly of F1-ATPase